MSGVGIAVVAMLEYEAYLQQGVLLCDFRRSGQSDSNTTFIAIENEFEPWVYERL